jgi:hypothetical protein
LKIIVFISILFSVTILSLFSLFNNSFGASTPVNLKTVNQTNQPIEIYSIVFWDKPFVFYDKALNPNQNSTDFWFEFDSADKFWLIAKNDKDEIIFLKEFNKNDSISNFENIKTMEHIHIEDVSLGKELISKFDKKYSIETKLFWTNCILLVVLLVILLRKKTAGNKVLPKAGLKC